MSLSNFYHEETLENNINEMEKLLLIQNKLGDIIAAIVYKYESKLNTSVNTTLFNHMILNWKVYRRSKADFDSISYLGKENYNLYYSKSMIETTNKKIDELQIIYSNLL